MWVDLYRANDTYWKNWLKFRADTGIIPPFVQRACKKKDDDELAADENDEAAGDDERVQADETTIAKTAVGTGLAGSASELSAAVFAFGGIPATDLPKGLDQVLNYAGHLLKTIVSNNAWVPLISRLTRLTKETLKGMTAKSYDTVEAADGSQTRKLVGNYTVMSKIRAKDSPTFGDEWHPQLTAYVQEVRTRLKMSGSCYLHDEYGL